ncbi:expressed unknown protein [Seminavis robusta]|uniref:Uncharacterized protein n=1 Tax=Seminavis robusta TaxID=568900 RepID=A0A9N8H677_9STRA|nr:expressed unknown protein [Seminavis robusta]|eukprot:Sro163_g073270.1 n/a (424) ;mRNA; f:60574-61845
MAFGLSPRNLPSPARKSQATEQSKRKRRRMFRCSFIKHTFVTFFLGILAYRSTTYYNKTGETRKPVVPNLTAGPPVTVFYNLFIQDESDVSRVTTFVREQLAPFVSSKIFGAIYIKSIGVPVKTTLLELQDHFSKTPAAAAGIEIQHFEKGDESRSLHDLWSFCRSNSTHPDQVVAYLHSKGSFTPDPANNLLRRYLTKAVLTPECAQMPKDKCNVCSARFSPLPHPHTGGNMWTARCDYIAQLADPSTFIDTMGGYFAGHSSAESSHCLGTDRYALEHWVHAHPDVQPCDVDGSSSFLYGYHAIPTSFTVDLQQAPRIPLSQYPETACNDFGLEVEDRIAEYYYLYEKLPPNTWFGWRLFNDPWGTITSNWPHMMVKMGRDGKASAIVLTYRIPKDLLGSRGVEKDKSPLIKRVTIPLDLKR